MKSKWTEAHQIEALRWALRWADEAASEGGLLDDGPLLFSRINFKSEDAFAVWCNAFEIDPAPAIHRVRALVEGRLVRDIVWRVRYIIAERMAAEDTKNLDRDSAIELRKTLADSGCVSARLVRVTRIRRA